MRNFKEFDEAQIKNHLKEIIKYLQIFLWRYTEIY